MKQIGIGKIYLRGNIWWIDFWHLGRRYRESSHSSKEKDAWKLLKRRLKEMGVGRPIGPQIEKTTFEGLEEISRNHYKANQCRSLKRLNTAYTHLREFFSRSRALDITFDRLTAYVAYRQEENAASSTISYELAILRHAMKLAEKSGKALCPPFPTVHFNNARKGFFERRQFEAVLKNLPSDLRPLFTTAYHTGWRTRSELLPIDLGASRFHCGHSSA